MTKLLVILLLLIATPTLAASKKKPLGPNPNAVMDGNKKIGEDPDPWIRLEILRHAHSGWPD